MTDAEQIARAVLEAYSSPYWCANLEGTETIRTCVVREAAKQIQPLLDAIRRAAVEAVATNPT